MKNPISQEPNIIESEYSMSPGFAITESAPAEGPRRGLPYSAVRLFLLLRRAPARL